MGEGGEWENDSWVDLRTDRHIKLQHQGVGARPWILERQNGLARGIHNRVHADGRYAGCQLISGNTVLLENYAVDPWLFGLSAGVRQQPRR